ncbi:DoxX family protein [Roseivirga sp. E12]|uniref:DoxX family protein n=1 Tax=Roseivirga sp. E12 TaxID=2819237 RepID=UPI001ABC246D|nr:DoxX family protein [Roseivirga sp. E12]MBO3698112.1 DoxX family protein [Roseivirga sp. E12]
MSSKVKNIVAWILSMLTGLYMLGSGYPKVSPSEGMVRRFENWGYSAEFSTIIGVLEILSGILIFIPKTAFYGGVLLSILMLGAIYTHLTTGIGGPMFAIIILLLALAIAYLRFDDKLSIKK